MTAWIAKFRKGEFKTFNFYFNVFIYGAAIVLSTLYVYARLDYVRSYALPHTQIEKNK